MAMGKQNPELLQVLVCQIAQKIDVHGVCVERGLVLFEAQASQPTPDLHLAIVGMGCGIFRVIHGRV
jgi:hypothetical protein